MPVRLIIADASIVKACFRGCKKVFAIFFCDCIRERDNVNLALVKRCIDRKDLEYVGVWIKTKYCSLTTCRQSHGNGSIPHVSSDINGQISLLNKLSEEIHSPL